MPNIYYRNRQKRNNHPCYQYSIKSHEIPYIQGVVNVHILKGKENTNFTTTDNPNEFYLHECDLSISPYQIWGLYKT